LDFLLADIEELKREGLFRDPFVFECEQAKTLRTAGKTLLNFCSNDYLGLCSRKEVKEAQIDAINKWGNGSGASRLVTGTMSVHRLLEEKLALFEKKESAILFPTGYMANVGTISSLLNSQDAVIVDRLNHASIIDGARLSGAKIYVFAHSDMNRLESILKRSQNKRRRLVVTDSVFSMDGDLAYLRDIVFLKEKYSAILMLDEAHGTGVFGESGAGLSEELGVKGNVDILMGTLSKAVGVLGGFVAGDKTLTDYLLNKARSYIYTTSSPPALCAGNIKALEIIESEPDVRKRLRRNAAWVRSEIKKMGFDILNSESQIVPVIVGGAKKAVEYSKALMKEGIFVQAIRPPTVPKGTSRLRITISALHEKADLEELVAKLKNIV